MSPERREFCAYIMSSASGVLYTGSARDLFHRVYQHRHGPLSRFTAAYRVTRLVWYDCTPNSRAAVALERRIKRWSRIKKVRLIESLNPGWQDLAEAWFRDRSGQDPSLRPG